VSPERSRTTIVVSTSRRPTRDRGDVERAVDAGDAAAAVGHRQAHRVRSRIARRLRDLLAAAALVAGVPLNSQL
jgi:hypothetical protein